MKKIFVGVAATAAALTFTGVADAALSVGPPYGGTYAEPAITAPDAGLGAECQAAITKNSQKYVKSLVKTRGKCLSAGDARACPNTDDDEKVQSAASKAAAAIASACGDSSGLNNAYDVATAENIASCTLSQHHGTVEIFLGETHGNGGRPSSSFDSAADTEARAACQAAINKNAQKLLPGLLKTVDKCIQGRIKSGEGVGDLGGDCVGSMTASVRVAPDDEKTAESMLKQITKANDAISGACGTLSADNIGWLFGCPLADSVADLQACVENSALNAMFELVNQQYTETGSIVSPAAGAIQAAVNAASAGDKLLVASGNYNEGVLLQGAFCSGSAASCLSDSECPMGETCDSDNDGLQIVGCGAATDDRPRVIPPLMGAPTRGFQAAGVDGVHFQALEVTGWTNDGIFVTNAEGVSFRDIFGDGDDLSTPALDSVSTYAVFPVTSNDVVVEGCEVVNVRDAGIYVGQSIDIITRHNYVHDNVTGIEIENSEFADVYGNVATDNTGGLLSFKLSSPVKQTSGGHHFFDNTTYGNNTPNFGIPGTTVGSVIPGTGFMVISEDNSVFENNIVESNESYGILILDQEEINALLGEALFDPPSPDQDISNLTFSYNRMPAGGSRSNGTTSDMDIPYPGNWTYAITTDGDGTCFEPLPLQGDTTALDGVSSFPACP